MSVIIYSKSNCPFCTKAKQFLTQKGVSFTEHVLGTNVTKEDIQAKVNSLGVNTQVKTVPQIFYTNKSGKTIHIGGYTELLTQQQILGT